MNAEIEEYLKNLVQEIANEKGFIVPLFECGEGDHIQCFETAAPLVEWLQELWKIHWRKRR